MPPDELPDDLFAAFRAMIERETGIRVPETKRVLVSNRIRRRVRATGAGGFAAYHDLLNGPGGVAERGRFVDAVTTQETFFFRDAHHFDWLADRFAPELLDRAVRGLRPRRVALWSAACSTGEEVYSALIRLAERRFPPAGWSSEVLATDISPAALEAARAASYADRALRQVDPERRERFFEPDPADPGRRVVRPRLRRLVRFRLHNLLEPIGEGPFDCIFLKNVLIYFGPEAKRAAVDRVTDALAPGGYLVVGPTEGVFTLLGHLERLEGWLYRRPEGG